MMSDKVVESKTISKEQIITKRKELVAFVSELKNQIEQTNISEQDKQVLLSLVQKILDRAILTEEVVRLADVVYKITKAEETDIKFKGFLKSSLYKIYRSD